MSDRTDEPREPDERPAEAAGRAPSPGGAPSGEPAADEWSMDEPGFVPPDPDEPPPLELGRVATGVLPWGSTSVMFVWGVIFLVMAVRRDTLVDAAMFAWGANAGGLPPAQTAWRLLASTFLHAGTGHVFMNALSLLMFGPVAEALFTRWAFWIVYAFGGAAASLGSVLWHSARHGAGSSMSVGGSGAIFALGGALLAAAWRLRGHLAVGRARALGAGLLFLLSQSLVAGFARLGTDNFAHASGLAAGIALGAVLPLAERVGGRRAGIGVRLVGLTAVLAMAAAVAAAFRGGLWPR